MQVGVTNCEDSSLICEMASSLEFLGHQVFNCPADKAPEADLWICSESMIDNPVVARFQNKVLFWITSKINNFLPDAIYVSSAYRDNPNVIVVETPFGATSSPSVWRKFSQQLFARGLDFTDIPDETSITQVVQYCDKNISEDEEWSVTRPYVSDGFLPSRPADFLDWLHCTNSMMISENRLNADEVRTMMGKIESFDSALLVGVNDGQWLRYLVTRASRIVVIDNSMPHLYTAMSQLKELDKEKVNYFLSFSADYSVLSQIQEIDPFDLLVMDADQHSYSQCFRSILEYGRFVKIGGTVVLHIIQYETERIVRSLRKMYQVEVVQVSGGGGLAFYKKTKEWRELWNKQELK